MEHVPSIPKRLVRKKYRMLTLKIINRKTPEGRQRRVYLTWKVHKMFTSFHRLFYSNNSVKPGILTYS